MTTTAMAAPDAPAGSGSTSQTEEAMNLTAVFEQDVETVLVKALLKQIWRAKPFE